MHVSIFPTLILASAPVATSDSVNHVAPLIPSQDLNRRSDDNSNACAQLSSRSISYLSAHSSAEQVPFKPSLVLDCFRDIPINANISVELINWIKPFVEFQTTLSWLKTPPQSYPRPPVDVVQSLVDLAQRVSSDYYTNEFDFEVDLMAAFNAAADLHLSYQPYLPASLAYGAIDRGAPLVSVSSDSKDLPQIYFLADIEAAILRNASFEPSAVTSIDGKDPMTLLNHISQNNPVFTDQDGGFNALLANPVPPVYDVLGLFNSGFDPNLKDSSTYTFANGSETRLENIISLPPFQGKFESGKDLYDALILAAPNSSPSSTKASKPRRSSTDVSSRSVKPLYPGFPTPIITQDVPSFASAISGYFLPDSDTAVLSITSFNYFGESADTAFQTTIRKFLAKCRTANKTRLIIDLRRNIGGQPALAFDLYRQLFPGKTPFSRTRLHGNRATNALGRTISSLRSGFPANVNASVHEALVTANTSYYNSHVFLQSPDGAHFGSWPEFFGPTSSHGDEFTHEASWLLSDPTYTEAEFKMVISGYGNESSVPPSPFAADQITLLSDGMCSSACAAFARLMVDEGVQSVSAGGRPSRDSMAVIGGTQGEVALSFDFIAQLAKTAIGVAEARGKKVPELEPLIRERPVQAGPGTSLVNIMDNLGRNEEDLTPLQFTRWMADCRMFYTPRDIVDVQNTWMRVAKGFENGGEGLCAQGSLSERGKGPVLTNSAMSLRHGQWVMAVLLLAQMVFLF